jgi:hypothetical protein
MHALIRLILASYVLVFSACAGSDSESDFDRDRGDTSKEEAVCNDSAGEWDPAFGDFEGECVCPNYAPNFVPAAGGCLEDHLARDICLETGGEWEERLFGFVCLCGNNVPADSDTGECPVVTIEDLCLGTSGTYLPGDDWCLCPLGPFIPNAGGCVSDEVAQTTCEDSAGTWAEVDFEMTCTCSEGGLSWVTGRCSDAATLCLEDEGTWLPGDDTCLCPGDASFDAATGCE